MFKIRNTGIAVILILIYLLTGKGATQNLITYQGAKKWTDCVASKYKYTI